MVKNISTQILESDSNNESQSAVEWPEIVLLAIQGCLIIAQLIFSIKFYIGTRNIKEVGWLPKLMTVFADI